MVSGEHNEQVDFARVRRIAGSGAHGCGVAAGFIAAPAAAQDYTSGAIIGTVTSRPALRSPARPSRCVRVAQGQVRTFVTNGNGTFTASGLAPGEYAITVAAPGYQPYDDTLTVTAAQESRVTVGLVSASPRPARSSSPAAACARPHGGTTGLNVDVAAVNPNAPIAHNITARHPARADRAARRRGFAAGDVPSIGGSSVAENAYYINGLNITNPDTYVGSARVPFYFYKNVDVQTGGYPAEFGRATGWRHQRDDQVGHERSRSSRCTSIGSPTACRAHRPNIGDPRQPDRHRQDEQHDTKQLTIEAGGAIIPDHLFVYGLVEAAAEHDRIRFGGSGHTF